MNEPIRRRPRDSRGAVATEYALLTALIALVIFAMVAAFGDNVADLFDRSCASVAATNGNTCH